MQSLWMILAALLFSAMGTMVKLASDLHSAWELLFWRNLVGIVVLVPVLRRMRGGLRHNLATPHWPGHIVRNVAGTFAVVLWFSAISHLPLGMSMTLNYTSSLFIGLIVFVSAAWAGKHAGSVPLLGTLLLGFAGIVLVLRPTVAHEQLVWAMMGLGSGMLAAVALLSVRALGALGEAPQVIVFFFTLSGLLVGAVGMLVAGAHWPDREHLALLVGVGISAVVAQLSMTRAYSRGHTLLAANLNYTGILFASFFGWLIWGDLLPAVAWVGVTFIIASGVTATWLTSQRRPPAAHALAAAAQDVP